ncbi:MAG TPA: endonuclease III [Planctomycetaceae bacterium]|nr:endonuclease III [Planctomycetaceae bacterium]
MSTDLLSADEIEELYTILSREMPGRSDQAKGPKRQPSPFRSCISCMLSAQSRDENTALATRALFRLARTPRTMLKLRKEQIANAIRPCGLYNNKARNVLRFCEALIADFGGVVPRTRDELMSLPGIGRKCADIVLQFTFGIDTIAVDTHVHRVSNRTGLAEGKTGEQTARSLEERSPRWVFHEGHFWLIQFGKAVCTSQAPKCPTCPVKHLCKQYQRTVGGAGNL